MAETARVSSLVSISGPVRPLPTADEPTSEVTAVRRSGEIDR